MLYAPGLPDLDSIRAVVRAVAPKPVNVLTGPARGAVPLETLAEAGVRRVSLGGALYRRAMAVVAEAAREIAAGRMGAAAGGVPSAEIERLLPPPPSGA